MKNLAIIFVCMLAFQMASVDAIKCYVCSDMSSNCASNPTDGCTSCLITKSSASAGGITVNTVSKTCSPTSGSGCTTSNVNGASANQCYCTTDLCDTSSSLAGYTYSLVLAMVALLFAFY